MSHIMVILGGSGFIGSKASVYFQKSHKIYVIDSTPPKTPQKGVTYLTMNIRDHDRLHSALVNLNPQFVLHLASKSTVSACHEAPEEAYLDNVLGTLNVLTSCKALLEHPYSFFQKLIVHTSDKVYGEHPSENLPYLESYPHYRADVYSTSKAAQDMMTLCWAFQYKLPFSTVRSGNIYGPGDLNFSRLIPQTIKRLIQGERAIIYKGNDKAMRDFVYIDDLLSAYEYIFSKGENQEAYNVGGSGPIAVAEVVKIIKSAIGKEDEPNVEIQRDLYEFKAQYLDTKKLRSLGWKPKVSLLEGIKLSIPFYQNFLPKLLTI